MGSVVNAVTGTTNNYQGATSAITHQDLSGALAGSQGTINNNITAEQALAAQQAAVANGTANNAAQSQYQQNVDQNAQQTAGAIASQKGINPALAARLATNQMANAGQAAAGTEATNQMTQQNTALNNQASLLNNVGTQAQANNATAQTAQANQNSAINTATLGKSQIDAGVAAGNQTQNAATTSGIMNGASSIMSMFADGGLVDNSIPNLTVPTSTAPPASSSGGGGGGGGAGIMSLLALLAKGGQVPGHAAVPGNSFKNDTVPAMLSPGEVVLPRSVTTAPNSPAKAKEFLQALQSKGGGSPASNDGPKGYAKVLQSQRELQATLVRIESKLKGGK